MRYTQSCIKLMLMRGFIEKGIALGFLGLCALVIHACAGNSSCVRPTLQH